MRKYVRRQVPLLEIMTNEADSAAKIIVVGVGGAGNNAVNSGEWDQRIIHIDRHIPDLSPNNRPMRNQLCFGYNH